MTERKPLPRYWRPSEMQTWAAPEGGLVHMFPEGIGWKTLSACGQSVMKRDPEEEEYGPLEEWANGSPNRRELCTDCLDLWWNGPAHRRDRMYEDLWSATTYGNGKLTSHLCAGGVYQTACGIGHDDFTPVPLVQRNDTRVCHRCAVIWDTQQARRAGMDDSEERGWGAAYGDGEKIHRFRNHDMQLGGTLEVTYCTPHRVPMLGHMRGTLDEYVDPVVDPCPVCLVATDEAEAEVPEPIAAPLDLWGKGTGRLIHWVPVRRPDGALHASACETRCARISHVRPVEEYPSSSHPLFCGPCERLHAEAVQAYRAQVIKKAQEVRTVAKRVRKW